jgi:hypothetical protein
MPATEVRVFKASDDAETLLDWLRNLKKREPKAYKKCLARIIDLSKRGSDMHRHRVHAAYLRDGIYELRTRLGRVNYRILYFFMGKDIVALSHGFTKEGLVPPSYIDLAVEQKKLVLQFPDKHTINF